MGILSKTLPINRSEEQCAVKPFLQTKAFAKILYFTVFRSGAVHAGTDVFHLILTGSNH
jgi:hypothetical protein